MKNVKTRIPHRNVTKEIQFGLFSYSLIAQQIFAIFYNEGLENYKVILFFATSYFLAAQLRNIFVGHKLLLYDQKYEKENQGTQDIHFFGAAVPARELVKKGETKLIELVDGKFYSFFSIGFFVWSYLVVRYLPNLLHVPFSIKWFLYLSFVWLILACFQLSHFILLGLVSIFTVFWAHGGSDSVSLLTLTPFLVLLFVNLSIYRNLTSHPDSKILKRGLSYYFKSHFKFVFKSLVIFVGIVFISFKLLSLADSTKRQLALNDYQNSKKFGYKAAEKIDSLINNYPKNEYSKKRSPSDAAGQGSSGQGSSGQGSSGQGSSGQGSSGQGSSGQGSSGQGSSGQGSSGQGSSGQGSSGQGSSGQGSSGQGSSGQGSSGQGSSGQGSSGQGSSGQGSSGQGSSGQGSSGQGSSGQGSSGQGSSGQGSSGQATAKESGEAVGSAKNEFPINKEPMDVRAQKEERINSLAKKLNSILEFCKEMFLILFLGLFVFLMAHIFRSFKKKSITDDIRNQVGLSPEIKKAIRRKEYLLEKSNLTPEDEVLKSYKLFLEIMAFAQFPKETWMPVKDFESETIVEFKQIQSSANILSELYCRTYYGKKRVTGEQLQNLRKARKYLAQKMVA